MKLIFAIFLLICGFVCVTKSQQVSINNESLVYIVGDVAKPAKILFREAMTLTQVIKETGGILPNNKRREVYIYRLIPGTKDREMIKVNWKALQKKRIDDFVLQPSDIVDVSVRKEKKSKSRGELFFLASDKPTVFYKLPIS